MPQVTLGSRVRKSPYWDATVAAGLAEVTIYNHMYLPIGYGDPEAEYRRLTEAVACWDVGAQRQVEVAGPDARMLVDRACARDLSTLRPGRARYAPVCDRRGVLVNDPVVLCLDEERFWLSLADSDVRLLVDALAAADHLDVRVDEPDVSPLAIQGPAAEALAGDLFGAELVSTLGFFHHREVELDGIPLVLCRSGWSKQGGFELFLTDGTRGVELWDAVMAAGRPYGIGPGAPNQAERLESGLLSYATDTDDDTDPIEAGLGAYVHLDHRPFHGADALAERWTDPQRRRRLVNVAFESSEPPPCENPWPAVTADGTPAVVRTAARSPRLGRVIGLALIPIPAAEPGTTLTVATPAGDATAVVSDVPFGTPWPS